jgi:hypothetical protein
MRSDYALIQLALNVLRIVAGIFRMRDGGLWILYTLQMSAKGRVLYLFVRSRSCKLIAARMRPCRHQVEQTVAVP